MITNNGKSEILGIICLKISVHSNLTTVIPHVIWYLYGRLSSVKKDNTLEACESIIFCCNFMATIKDHGKYLGNRISCPFCSCLEGDLLRRSLKNEIRKYLNNKCTKYTWNVLIIYSCKTSATFLASVLWMKFWHRLTSREGTLSSNHTYKLCDLGQVI